MREVYRLTATLMLHCSLQYGCLKATATLNLFGSRYPHSVSHSVLDLSVVILSCHQKLPISHQASAGRSAVGPRNLGEPYTPWCDPSSFNLPLPSCPGRFPITRHILRGSRPHHPIFHSQPLAPAFLGRLNLRVDGRLERPHEWDRLQWQHVIIPLHTRPSPALSRKEVIPPLLFM